MGYRLCIKADFQNAFISLIFRVFFALFLQRTYLNDL